MDDLDTAFAALFQSTPPRGGRPLQGTRQYQAPAYFNPRPREGGDKILQGRRHAVRDFNPRPPRGGATRKRRRLCRSTAEFQSTPPARGATAAALNAEYSPIISIHAPREGGDFLAILQRSPISISIHAPREGGDPSGYLPDRVRKAFQSTPPARGATQFPDRHLAFPS